MKGYARYRPSARLEPFVEAIWVQEDRTDASCHPFPATRVLPTGTPDIAFHFHERFERVDADGRTGLPDVVVTGPQTSFREYAATGRTGIVLVRFRPGGAASILRVPQRELRDRNVDLADCVGARATRRVMNRVRSARTRAERVACVLDFLESRLGEPGPAAVRAAVARIAVTRGTCAVPALAREAGLGTRQLQRRFAEHVGVSPKTLGRLIRFQHALELHAAGATWSMTALDAGYQDQSHLANDCRSLSGLSPGQVFRRQRATPLARFFNAGDETGSAIGTIYL